MAQNQDTVNFCAELRSTRSQNCLYGQRGYWNSEEQVSHWLDPKEKMGLCTESRKGSLPEELKAQAEFKDLFSCDYKDPYIPVEMKGLRNTSWYLQVDS